MSRAKSFYQQTHFWLPVVAIVAVTLGLVVQPAIAGPVTNPGKAPFVKVGIYQGVIGIIPGTSTSGTVQSGGDALEIGNAGKDIASTGPINIRPGSLTVAQGATIKPTNLLLCQSGVNGGKTCLVPTDCPGSSCTTAPAEAALYLGSGRICLNKLAAAIGGGTDWQCVSSWASTGTGDILWSLTTGILSPQPTDISKPIDTIRIGSPAAPVPQTNVRGLDIYTSFAGAAVVATEQLTTGYPDVNYNIIGGSVHVTKESNTTTINGQVRIKYTTGQPASSAVHLLSNSFAPWTAVDKYNPLTAVGSGIDADTFYGTASLPFPTNHNLFWKSSTLIGGSGICLQAQTSKICTGGTNAGTDCSSNALICVGPGAVCASMCGGINSICSADADGQAITGTKAQPAEQNQICGNYNKRVTHFCRGGTSPSYPSASSPCDSNYDCQTANNYGSLSYCTGAQVTQKCNGSGAAFSCSTNAQCVTHGNQGCGAQNCEGNGVPRFSVTGGNGYCYHDEFTCTNNTDCDVTDTSGTLVDSGQCVTAGFCSTGTNPTSLVEKTCVGGDRASDACDKENLCIGGTWDNTAQTQAVCEAGNGKIGNAIDYCPGGGVCKASRLCTDNGQCDYALESCSFGQFYPGNATNFDDTACTNACQQGVTVNRCRGATDVYGANLPVCSAYGSDLRYTTGRLFTNNLGNRICDCTTVQQQYSKAATGVADLCTTKFL